MGRPTRATKSNNGPSAASSNGAGDTTAMKANMLRSDVMAMVESEAADCFERLGIATRTLCPGARVSISRTGGAETGGIVASFLGGVALDEVAVSVELESGEGVPLRCEVTLFVGQRTHLNVSKTGWADLDPLTNQVRKIVGESLLLIEPYALEAFRGLVVGAPR
jgi:hypothetical protein